MKCRDAETLFSAYMDDALTPGEARELDGHLSVCTECSAELASWKASGMALTEVLDCEAVPSKSLEDFVAACTAEAAPPGIFAKMVRYFTAPRHAVVATAAGSLMLTFILLTAIWCSVLIGPPSVQGREQMTSPMQQYQLADVLPYFREEGSAENGT